MSTADSAPSSQAAATSQSQPSGNSARRGRGARGGQPRRAEQGARRTAADGDKDTAATDAPNDAPARGGAHKSPRRRPKAKASAGADHTPENTEHAHDHDDPKPSSSNRGNGRGRRGQFGARLTGTPANGAEKPQQPGQHSRSKASLAHPGATDLTNSLIQGLSVAPYQDCAM